MVETAQLSDEQIIEIVREKNQNLYAEIIKRYEAKLTRYLRRFVRDSDELSDIIQDVFIKTYQNLHDFDINKKFSSWIYRIAHNEALNHTKRNKNKISLDEKEMDILDESLDLKNDTDRRLLSVQIGDALQKIKDKYREAIILFYLEEKTYDEVSDIMHVPRNTAGTLISRGKQALKKQLEKQPYGK
ncbi:MAG TPA: RNA polymerase sigma factor [Candidatus Magasanikbacteria bacterium]|nr:RNA polymerase sigma factor [Candidatus Magasanikbacteria bacterium]